VIDTPPWVRDAVFYQIFPDRFAASDRVPKPGHLQAWSDPPTTHGFKGGDLLGIAEHLPMLAELGINALYLTPIFASASNHRYHTYDYLRVDPLLGGDAALRELLDGAHARGMRVILDGVFNHTGRGFWAFHHLLENGASSPYLDWFREDRGALDGGLQLLAYPDTGRTVSAPGQPGDSASSLERLGYEAWWGLPALPKLNTDYQPVRDYLLTVAEHWIRFGIDGWRLDVPEEIADPTFWQAFRSRVRAVNPEAYLVGEIWHVAPDWTAGDRFDAAMNYPLAEAILGFAGAHHLDDAVVHSHAEYSRIVRLSGAEIAERIETILAAYRPETDAVQLNLLDSHDTPRIRTLLSGDVAGIRIAYLLQVTLPGAPCIYYGDEIGPEGANDPDNRRAYPWDESAWDQPTLTYLRAALGLRRAQPILRTGGLRIVGTSGDSLAILRSGQWDERSTLPDGALPALVVVNAGEGAAALTIEAPELSGVRLGSALVTRELSRDGPDEQSLAGATVGAGGHLELIVPARYGVVLLPA
jgi:cyclomaltodextrinase / maltogenic alpha-amylase / neopullulanase